MMKFIFSYYYKLKFQFIHSYHYRVRKNKSELEKKLIETNQTKWLDIGCSVNNLNSNFYFADLYPKEECLDEMKSKYYQLDVSKPLDKDIIKSVGKFHFIRMQHVFEHFTYEQASIVLDNCFELLEDKGKLLISVPDLDIYIKRYLNKTLKQIPEFAPWAHKRINSTDSDSDFFSIYAHSMLHEKHLWCYNKDGLVNKIKKSNKFKNVKRIGLLNKLSGIPFTHNRPQEDLCVIATKN